MENANETNNRRYLLLSRLVKLQVIIAIFTIAISIIVGLRISPLIKQKAQLELEVKQKTEELNRLRRELEETNKALQAAAPLLNLSENDVALLKDLPSNALRGGAEEADVAKLVEQSREAVAELQKYRTISSERNRRATITIRYYPKRVDQEQVKKAVETLKNEYGFRRVVEVGEPGHPDVPTNSIGLLNPGVTADDVKIIAYNLIRFGIKLQYIGPTTDRLLLRSLRDKRVHIQSEPQAINEPPLTVDQIRSMTLEKMWEGTKRLEPTRLPGTAAKKSQRTN